QRSGSHPRGEFLSLFRNGCRSRAGSGVRWRAGRPRPASLLLAKRKAALGAFDYVELNLLTFLQAAKPVCLDGGEVHENVFTILAADKTIALGIVKPLYGSCFHDVAVFLCVEVCAETRIVQAGHAVERGTAHDRKDQTH